jgi:hypothetical protein
VEIGGIMAENTAPPIQHVIKTFKWRALRRQLGAYFFFGLMLAGIGVAAWVFSQAKEITASDTNTDVNAKISSLKKTIDNNNLKLRDTGKSLNAAYLDLLHELPFVTRDNCKHIVGGQWEDLQDLSFFFEQDGRLRSKPEVAKQLYQKVAPSSNIDCISIWVDQTQLLFNIGQLEEVKLQNWNNTTDASILSTLRPEMIKLVHQGQIYAKALQTLQDFVEQQEISPLIGETENKKTPITLTLPFLLQLNITRFGTITLVVIAIGILAPLYRFSARLATFYRARADILILHQMPGYKQIGIARLSPIFTPTFDFGKSQAIPDHLTELIRLALDHAKETE